jgi:inorganic pyrophosphatase
VVLQHQVAAQQSGRSTSPTGHGSHQPLHSSVPHHRLKSSILPSGREVRLTEAELASMRAIFNLFDRDGSNTISADDLRALHQKLGEPLSEEEAKEVIKDFGHGKGSLSFEDFIGLWEGTHFTLRHIGHHHHHHHHHAAGGAGGAHHPSLTVTATTTTGSSGSTSDDSLSPSAKVYKYPLGSTAEAFPTSSSSSGPASALPSGLTSGNLSRQPSAFAQDSAQFAAGAASSSSSSAGAGAAEQKSPDLLSPNAAAAAAANLAKKRAHYLARFKFLRAKLANPSVARIYAEVDGTDFTLEWRLRFYYDDEKTGEKRQISPWHDIPHRNENGSYNMLVEIPRYTRRKFEIATGEPFNPIKQDVKNGILREYAWGDMCWNYGCVPRTWEDPKKRHPATGMLGDSDPIDIIDVGIKQWGVGSIVAVKILGVLAMIDSGETDWKLLAINVEDPLAHLIHDLEDLEVQMPGTVASIHYWLKMYKSSSGESRCSPF